MSSAARGAITSAPEITNISMHGLWLFVGGYEYFLSFEQFPWFRDATLRAILNIEEPTPGHLYWPELDVDLGLEAIAHPERFPLVSK